jgi:hypothetical protein
MRRTIAAMWPLVLVLAGCYGSGSRSLITRDDGSSTPDVVDESLEDVVEDAIEEEDPPDPSCLYEAAGTRQLTDSDHAANAPHLFWNGSQVGVVLHEAGGSMTVHPYVSLTNVEPDLSSSTTPRIVGDTSHGWGEPAWTGEGFGLCWHTDPGMVGRTAFRLHDASGDRIGERVDLDLEGEACLGLAHGAGRFLASWRQDVWEEDEHLIDTRVQLLTDAGAPIGEPWEFVTGSPYPGTTPSLAFDGVRFVAAICDLDRIAFRWIDLAGEITSLRSIDAPGAAFADFALDGDRIAVAWITGERGERGLRFRVFDDMLGPAGEELLLEEEGAGAASPDVAAVDDGWAVSWHVGSGEEAYARLLHVDATGEPRQPRISLYEGHNSGYGGPALLALEASLYVAISHYPSGEWLEQTYMTRLECVPGTMDVCDAQDAELTDELCHHPVTLGWRWTGEACEELVGCGCTGEDCETLARSRWDCISDRVHCR